MSEELTKNDEIVDNIHDWIERLRIELVYAQFSKSVEQERDLLKKFYDSVDASMKEACLSDEEY